METRVLLLRHAETAAPECFHGAESDIPLGERGKLQAEEAARRLSLGRPDVVLSSTMRRARETAAAIASACGKVVVEVDGLHERRMGILSGRPRDEGLATYIATKTAWMAGDLDATHEGAESFAEIRDRVVPVFLGVAERYAGKTLVVVAHGVVIRVLLTSLLEGYSPADFDRIPIEFVGVHEIVGRGSKWRVEASPGPGLPRGEAVG